MNHPVLLIAGVGLYLIFGALSVFGEFKLDKEIVDLPWWVKFIIGPALITILGIIFILAGAIMASPLLLILQSFK